MRREPRARQPMMQRLHIGTTRSDRELAQRVARELQDELPDERIYTLTREGVYVTASRGTVSLFGTVEQQRHIQRAHQAAQRARGVRQVQNLLTTEDEFPILGFIPGEQVPLRDIGITGDEHCLQIIQQRFTDQDLQDMARDVYVTCKDGTMALYGYVRSEEHKDRLEQTIQEVEGIDDVDNKLIVREEGWQWRPDSEIREQVQEAVDDDLSIEVHNGIAILSGTVEDWDAEREAIGQAYEAGARRVVSRLQREDNNNYWNNN